MMTVDEFKRTSRAWGRRNAIGAIDTALGEFHTAYNRNPRNLAECQVAAQLLVLACDAYEEGNPQSRRLPGVRQLRRDAEAEAGIFASFARGSAAGAPLQQRYRELCLAQDAFVGGTGQTNRDPYIYNLANFGNALTTAINDVSNQLRGTQDGQAVLQREVADLRDIAGEVGVPGALANVINEATDPQIVNQTAMTVAIMAPMAFYTRHSEMVNHGIRQKYYLHHRLEQGFGFAGRMGALLHELTHVSIAETFSNSKTLIAAPVWMSHNDTVALAHRRLARIRRFRALLTANEGLFTESEIGELRFKSDYPLSDKHAAYRDRFTADLTREGDLARVNALINAGVQSALVEYDTVINQMFLWMYKWNIPQDSEPFTYLEALVGEAYRFRREERQRKLLARGPAARGAGAGGRRRANSLNLG